jgi:hypothetical protein
MHWQRWNQKNTGPSYMPADMPDNMSTPQHWHQKAQSNQRTKLLTLMHWQRWNQKYSGSTLQACLLPCLNTCLHHNTGIKKDTNLLTLMHWQRWNQKYSGSWLQARLLTCLKTCLHHNTGPGWHPTKKKRAKLLTLMHWQRWNQKYSGSTLQACLLRLAGRGTVLVDAIWCAGERRTDSHLRGGTEYNNFAISKHSAAKTHVSSTSRGVV